MRGVEHRSLAIKGGGLRGEGQRDGATRVADRQIRAAFGPAKTMKKLFFFNAFSIFCHMGSKMRQDVAKMREERPKISQERRKLSQDRFQDGPREGQDRAKLGQDAPRWPKMVPDPFRISGFGL